MASMILRLDFLRSTEFWAFFHTLLWLHRYLRLLAHCVSHWRYKSIIPNLEKPRYTSEDVTVVIPTIHNHPENLRPSLESILACNPAKLVLVTTWNKHQALSRVATSLQMPNHTSPVAIEVLYVDKANKRLQVCEALKGGHVKTAITVIADDDVEMGGVGTCQRVKRVVCGGAATRIFNWLGAAYIERRNFEISATHNIDGGTSCMSGRTGAYRTEILKSYDFLRSFKNEKWGRCRLNADDDNFITRWLCTYALHIATFTSLAFVVDLLLLFTCWWCTEDWQPRNRRILLGAEVAFMFGFTKVVKLAGLLRRNPRDIIFLPVSILFGYFHGLIKLYALCTLKEVNHHRAPRARPTHKP
ncbi:glycosyltransferase family 2 protein [Thermothelomyces thermophilus ATCC 42464]|uniref:Glycosyltransferase family 2 protein n=1 Tax=Thermothelomyces thermophilus (strain ATCC 42464 / BCRC 31852 / DSM 1799) TaxID=573729 RepID=G2QM34_THET4|nr:glycosyltransferase family 2 protein [Thermothelomyces thermophilus ATCC 42464]AEO61014.1 glycosyltransferase family 2 protein [Thermothelomyces thermophilus ATCC 42464]